ncbi:MAG: ATP-binding cassette domain-containing protein [Parvibaculaceae bacterium]
MDQTENTAAGAAPTDLAAVSQAMSERKLRPVLVGLSIFAFVLLAAAPMLVPPSLILVLGSALIMGLFALSLNLLLGSAGLITFGHAAYFGVGAYTVALFVDRLSWSPLVGLIAAPFAAAIASAILAPIVLRGKEIYFGLLTLGTAQLVYSIAQSAPAVTGGDEGLTGMFQPDWAFDLTLLYYFIFACVALGAAAIWIITRSPFGDALRCLRENNLRSQFIGISPKRYEFAAFVIAGFFAGFAGGLFTIYEGHVQVGLFFWQMSTTPLIVSLLGGFGFFMGPVVGAVFYTVLTDQLASTTAFWDVGVGLVVVVVAILLPEGLIGAIIAGVRRAVSPYIYVPAQRQGHDAASAMPAAAPQPGAPAEARAEDGAILLDVAGLSKSFGGLHATRNVALKVRSGTIHAIIGPNGAGKTTFFNLITGALSADCGTIIFDGKNVTQAPPWDRVKLGLGRTFQQPNVFPALTTLDNVALAEAGVRGDTARLIGTLPAEVRERAQAILRTVGLDGVAMLRAAELSHGDQRALEIAMGLAVKAKLICLDEPTAGVSPGETRQVVEAIRRIARSQGLTVLFVEHDMEIVFGIADRITVLCDGAVLAEGTPEEIRNNSDVQTAYLGVHHDGGSKA